MGYGPGVTQRGDTPSTVSTLVIAPSASSHRADDFSPTLGGADDQKHSARAV